MPRPKRERPKIRVNLDLDPDVKRILVDLKKRLGADSYSEVVRQGLFLTAFFLDESDDGYRIVARKGNRKEKELVLVVPPAGWRKRKKEAGR